MYHSYLWSTLYVVIKLNAKVTLQLIFLYFMLHYVFVLHSYSCIGHVLGNTLSYWKYAARLTTLMKQNQFCLQALLPGSQFLAANECGEFIGHFTLLESLSEGQNAPFLPNFPGASPPSPPPGAPPLDPAYRHLCKHVNHLSIVKICLPHPTKPPNLKYFLMGV